MVTMVIYKRDTDRDTTLENVRRGVIRSVVGENSDFFDFESLRFIERVPECQSSDTSRLVKSRQTVHEN